MRVLLTGSTGWLGRCLTPMLRARGHEVTGLDVAPGPDTQVVGTVADRALVERTMLSHGIEGVVHAAALHKPDIVRYPRASFVDVKRIARRRMSRRWSRRRRSGSAPTSSPRRRRSRGTMPGR